MYGELTIFSGNGTSTFADRVCERLGKPQGKAKVGRFSDGEIRVEIEQNVRGRDVFIIQSTCSPANDNLLELLIMCEACKRSSAGRITAVIPYFGYARQDRKVAPRAPITAKLIATLIQAAGFDRVLTMDLHAGQIQGFFDIPVDNLYAQPMFYRFMRDHLVHDREKTVIVSPDAGGALRARSYAKRLGCNLAIIDKRRDKPNSAEVMHIVGDVVGKDAIIVDDMVDTAGTLTKGGAAIAAHQAQNVVAFATHPVLSGKAIKRLSESVFEKLYVTDTIPLSEAAVSSGKIEVLSVTSLFAEAIRAIHFNDSISRLFLHDL